MAKMAAKLFLLFESASGYSLMDVKGVDELGQSIAKVQASMTEIERLSKVVELTAFSPFKSAAMALDQINAISESQMTDNLKNFLESNLPKVTT